MPVHDHRTIHNPNGSCQGRHLVAGIARDEIKRLNIYPLVCYLR